MPTRQPQKIILYSFETYVCCDMISGGYIFWHKTVLEKAYPSHKNKPRFSPDKPNKLISKLVRFNQVINKKVLRTLSVLKPLFSER